MAGGGIKINNTKIVGGADGATFTPMVDAGGYLSWSNNKGYTNPATVNIKGPKGDKGDKGDRGLQGVQGVAGPQGVQGATGAKLISQVLVGQDENGGNIYQQTFDDGTTTYWIAPKGEKGDMPDMSAYYTKAETDANLAEIERDIKVLGNALMQGGITYKPTTEDTYNERITAEGVNVVDGSKAVLKKVVGNTVACRNLFDKNSAIDGYEIINTLDGTLGVNAEWFTTDYIPVRSNTSYVVSGKPNGSAVMAYNSNKVVIKDLAGGANGRFTTTENTAFVRLNGLLIQKDTFQLEQGTTATEYQPYFTGLKNAYFERLVSTGRNLIDFTTPFVNSYAAQKPFSIAEGTYTLQVICDDYDGPKINVVAVEFLDENYNKVLPLNNGSDNGINSWSTFSITAEEAARTRYTSAYMNGQTGTDLIGKIIKLMLNYGTEALPYEPYTEDTLELPESIDCGLGVTIDFENKKITDYGVDLVLTGTEDFCYYKYLKHNGILVSGICQIGNKQVADYVSTDSNRGLDNEVYSSGKMWCGYAGSKNFFWIGILDILGYTTQGVEPTAEEKATAVANFKAWLAQRYADGNPVTIRYVSSVLQSETDFTADNEYTAYKKGTEKVLDNDGNEYGADNTLTQDYIAIKE